MTAIVLALASALSYGVSDFVGGYGGRRTSPWAIAVVGQATGLACVALLALTVDGSPTGADLAWGALAGIGSGLGSGFLYRGMSLGRMGVVAPVSAVTAAVVPIGIGVLAGERPGSLVWLGVLLALPGIWLVSSEPAPADGSPVESARAATVDGLLAGVGFGGLFAAIGQVPEGAGLLPLTLTQLTSVLAVVAVATLLRSPWVPRERAAGWGLLAGGLGAAATGGFMLAAQAGQLSVSGVLASLYPAFTVLLATIVLREPVHRAQSLGLGLCAVAVGLVVGGG